MSDQHNALHRCTELLQGFKRGLGMDRDADGVERVGETLTPVWDIWSKPEFARLRGEHLGAASLLVTGIALTRTIHGIRNISTPDDQWIVTVEPGTLYLVAGGVAYGAISTTDIADNTGFISRDGRRSQAPAMVRLRAENIAIPAGITAGQCFVGLNPYTVLEVKQEVILRCGQAMYFYSDTDAITCTLSAYVRSRKLYPGEHFVA